MDADSHWMNLAVNLAEQGRGQVEPNPVVGCAIVRDGHLLASGWHQRFGGPHAEVIALGIAGADARGSTLYVTLEPCAHFGKTPPCSDAIIEAGVARVVVATKDPFAQVAGRGIDSLRAAGIEVDVGIEENSARLQNAPFFKRVVRQQPWIMAKWAMSLDGKIATASGESQWITGPEARQHVHFLRGRMDAIVVGIGTALQDNPLLTGRPAGPRVATRVVIDSQARLPLHSQLVQTARDTPVLIAVGPDAQREKVQQLAAAGCEIWQSNLSDRDQRLQELLREFYERQFTNVMVEGGGELLAAFARLDQIDEIWTYIAPRLIGGSQAPHPIGGSGIQLLADSPQFDFLETLSLGTDFMIRARRVRDNFSADSFH